PLGRRLTAAVLPSEQPAGEREVRDVRNPELPTEREDVVVVAALEQAVLVLEHGEADRAVLARDAIRFRELRSGEVRAADCSYLARTYELVEGSERLGDRPGGIRFVLVVEVDVPGSQPFQRAVDRLAHGRRRAVRCPAELRREHHVVTTPLQ